MGPLSGYRIVEFAGIGPAPMCAMLLSDMGADVLRIDRTADADSDIALDAKYSLLNRGRRSVALDLKKPEGDRGGAEAGREGRRADRRLSSRRDRAARTRPRRLPQAQSAPRLRTHDRMGPGGSARACRRPRHQLHRAVGRARIDRTHAARRRCRRSTWSAISAAARSTWRSAWSRDCSRRRNRARARSSMPRWSTARPR